jgi:NAD(P)-dependent dehydrogenase (short-subunit alcohol dehydrogenase family)
MPQMTLKPVAQQVVVFMGASSGIGRVAAAGFAREGAKVVVVAARGVGTALKSSAPAKRRTRAGASSGGIRQIPARKTRYMRAHLQRRVGAPPARAVHNG